MKQANSHILKLIGWLFQPSLTKCVWSFEESQTVLLSIILQIWSTMVDLL